MNDTFIHCRLSYVDTHPFSRLMCFHTMEIFFNGKTNYGSLPLVSVGFGVNDIMMESPHSKMDVMNFQPPHFKELYSQGWNPKSLIL